MKYNNFFKIFTLFFIFIIFAISSYAENTASNVLSKILIERSENNSYSLNLFFNDKFEGRAFIQNKEPGNYYVFIPDTMMNQENIKLIYKDKHDKKNIKLNIEEKPFIKNNANSNYIRISVDIFDNSSIRLIAKTIDEAPASNKIPYINFSSLLIIIMIALAAFMITKVMKATKGKQNTNSFTAYPAGYLNSQKEYMKEADKETSVTTKPLLPKVNIKKTLKSSDSDSFSCFDIPLVNDIPQESFGFKNNTKPISGLLSKSKQTNPIKKASMEDSSEFALPMVEDIKTEEPDTNKINQPELLSELHLSPNKGFYLTTVDDKFALFGFVNDKVILLKRFEDLTQINLQARFYDKNNDNDMYIVRLDSYKAMVEISDSGMKELSVL